MTKGCSGMLHDIKTIENRLRLAGHAKQSVFGNGSNESVAILSSWGQFQNCVRCFSGFEVAFSRALSRFSYSAHGPLSRSKTSGQNTLNVRAINCGGTRLKPASRI
jgi:hypothetical protein